uniref:Uncharacterized protein n=1 Tax=viral metagenome TaxID=1070528 RepID=A0A6C0EAC4_9ZZZZ
MDNSDIVKCIKSLNNNPNRENSIIVNYVPRFFDEFAAFDSEFVYSVGISVATLPSRVCHYATPGINITVQFADAESNLISYLGSDEFTIDSSQIHYIDCDPLDGRTDSGLDGYRRTNLYIENITYGLPSDVIDEIAYWKIKLRYIIVDTIDDVETNIALHIPDNYLIFNYAFTIVPST